LMFCFVPHAVFFCTPTRLQQLQNHQTPKEMEIYEKVKMNHLVVFDYERIFLFLLKDDSDLHNGEIQFGLTASC
jgi:hypothetical protein